MFAEPNTPNDFNRWLDAALQARLGAEPRPGLEQRVLARLNVEPSHKAIVWWPALVAVAAALVISVALVLLHSPQKTSESAHTHVATGITATPDREPSLPASVARVQPAHNAKPRVTRASRHMNMEQERLPKLATFPATTPATDQERMLAALAIRRNSFEVAGDSPSIAPLKDLHIRELDVPLLEGTPPDAVSK
jgi:hypothetical protein